MSTNPPTVPRADVDDLINIGGEYRIGNVNVICIERRGKDIPTTVQ